MLQKKKKNCTNGIKKQSCAHLQFINWSDVVEFGELSEPLFPVLYHNHSHFDYRRGDLEH